MLALISICVTHDQETGWSVPPEADPPLFVFIMILINLGQQFCIEEYSRRLFECDAVLSGLSRHLHRVPFEAIPESISHRNIVS